MVHAYQKGELKNPSKEVEDIAKTISKKDAKDFAETKHKGLPNKVKKSVKETVTLSESQLRQIIAESVKKVLKEGDLFPNGMEITPARTAWEGIANALINIQQYMSTKKQDFEREYNFSTGEIKDITEADVKELVDYIDLTINNVLSASLPNIRDNK